MYIAKHYFETRFKRVFQKDEIVPGKIAKFYLKDVIEKEGELLIDDNSDVSTFTTFENPDSSISEDSNVEPDSLISEDEETEKSLKSKFKSKKKLEEYARTKGIELDRRKTLSHMIEEYLKLKNEV